MLQTSIILFLSGALFGTLGDFIHVITETDGYPTGVGLLPFTGQPLWVPLLFGFASVGIGLIHPQLRSRFGPKNVRNEKAKDCLLANVIFLLLYAASGLLPFETGGIKDGVLALGAIGVWYRFDRTWLGVVLCAGTTAIGVGVEIFLTQYELFYYNPQTANFFGVPSWLPWLYSTAATSVGYLGGYLLTRLNRSSHDFQIPLSQMSRV